MNLTIISFLCCQILSEVILHFSTGEVLAGSRLGHSIPVSGLRKRVHCEQIPLNLKFVETFQNILIQPHSICMDFITSVHERKCMLLHGLVLKQQQFFFIDLATLYISDKCNNSTKALPI